MEEGGGGYTGCTGCWTRCRPSCFFVFVLGRGVFLQRQLGRRAALSSARPNMIADTTRTIPPVPLQQRGGQLRKLHAFGGGSLLLLTVTEMCYTAGSRHECA